MREPLSVLLRRARCAVSGPFTEGTQEYAFVEFLVKVLGDPAATKAFFADQCASAAVSGALSPLYAGLQRLPPGASSVTACRDKGNGAEDLLACAPPSAVLLGSPAYKYSR